MSLKKQEQSYKIKLKSRMRAKQREQRLTLVSDGTRQKICDQICENPHCNELMYFYRTNQDYDP